MKLKAKALAMGLLVGIVLFYALFPQGGPTVVKKNNSISTKTNGSNLQDASIFDKLTDPAVLDAKSKTAEKMRLENWKKNFPWKPINDPDVKFDPFRIFYDYVGERNAQGVPQTAVENKTADNHCVLKKFYSDDTRFTPQFESFYKIMNEHDRGHNPAEAASVFNALRKYYHAAIEHGPTEKHEYIGDPSQKPSWHPKTWGEQAKTELDNLRGRLMFWYWLDQEFDTNDGQAKLMGLIDRLVTEVEQIDLLPIDAMDYAGISGLWESQPEAQGLLDGTEDLLVPYVGWNEAAEQYQAEQDHQFRLSYQSGDPSLKAAAPELFPPVGIQNGQLVDKDGDPVKWHEGMEIGLINERGERVPYILEEDGTVSLPTPSEVNAMRERGEVRKATDQEIVGVIEQMIEQGRQRQEAGN